MVIVYALSTCPWCKKVKQLLNDKGVQFKAIDVDLVKGDEQQEALQEVERLTGKRSFPVTLIGDNVILGYKEDKILEALNNVK